MEKLKEEIKQALKESATISPVDGGVLMSIMFDRQCDSIMKVIQPLLEADEMVRRMAENNKEESLRNGFEKFTDLLMDADNYVDKYPK